MFLFSFFFIFSFHTFKTKNLVYNILEKSETFILRMKILYFFIISKAKIEVLKLHKLKDLDI